MNSQAFPAGEKGDKDCGRGDHRHGGDIHRFEDLDGRVIGLRDARFSPEDPVFRCRESGEPVILFQVANLPPSSNGNARVETAWILGGDEGRDVYQVEQTGRGFELRHERAILVEPLTNQSTPPRALNE